MYFWGIGKEYIHRPDAADASGLGLHGLLKVHALFYNLLEQNKPGTPIIENGPLHTYKVEDSIVIYG